MILPTYCYSYALPCDRENIASGRNNRASFRGEVKRILVGNFTVFNLLFFSTFLPKLENNSVTYSFELVTVTDEEW
jgi:hypothetical protein